MLSSTRRAPRIVNVGRRKSQEDTQRASKRSSLRTHGLCSTGRALDTLHVMSYALNVSRPQQRSLFGFAEPRFDGDFARICRISLTKGAWVDHESAWLEGHEVILDALWSTTRW